MPVLGGARLGAAAPQFARRGVAMRGLRGVSGAVAQDHRISDRVRAADRTAEFWSMERRRYWAGACHMVYDPQLAAR